MAPVGTGRTPWARDTLQGERDERSASPKKTVIQGSGLEKGGEGKKRQREGERETERK